MWRVLDLLSLILRHRVYDTGLHLQTGDLFVLTWPATAFYDAEDSQVLTRYQWALGKVKDTCFAFIFFNVII